MRMLIWKEWHEQSWKLGFGCIVLASFSLIGLRARTTSDEMIVMCVCIMGVGLLPILSSTGLVPAERSEGSLEALLVGCSLKTGGCSSTAISPWRNCRGLRLCLSRGLFVVEAPRIAENTHRFSASIPREIHGATPRGSFTTGCYSRWGPFSSLELVFAVDGPHPLQLIGHFGAPAISDVYPFPTVAFSSAAEGSIAKAAYSVLKNPSRRSGSSAAADAGLTGERCDACLS